MNNVNYNLVNAARKIKKRRRLTTQEAYAEFIKMLQKDLQKTKERHRREWKDG